MSSKEPGKTLLIVDDSKVSRMVIKAHVLAVHPDWQVSEAANGEEAIRQVQQGAPDFCTMDINMPGMLGTDAAAQILQSHPAVRIAIFSANVQEAVQTRAQQLGAVFVAKPVTEKSIAQALRHFRGEW
ncbi:response regulator receiver protein [Herbaspirillum rubrisubalbicans]|jgi:CheY-like chemotaxis protein|uniref:Response regulator n=2 Tax=Herbaspirillum rubrisubalbicans TaxID=80842 RepID=A0AAD0XGT9_9BURK|nr:MULTISPECIES: response regulator [Herbaspirillum]ALU89039.1 response regulator receiver [Herbaspirillum rubrisubalbicans M1]AYR24064.1 response regulator [Herbaspirillum rubrisubalbicans]MCP1572001.1 CheY-like chemotaxis protein [Herbaspirillum rubrisubalbicans]NQE48481.1 response regulator receiver protein [Herbaspirillum rubrisubalbicans]QJQ00658.1 response regulator [Herbaspirillum rubrisubalbicans Os34]